MKTSLQELHHWVNTELKLDGYEHRVILDKIESMLEKEKEVMCEFAYKCHKRHKVYGDFMIQEYYNKTFNTKEK